MNPKNIILAGLGPHARRIYYPLLEKYANQYDIRIPLVIDLQDQADTICRYLSTRTLQPDGVIFLDQKYRCGDSLSTELASVLNQLVAEADIHGIIISTEPKAHKAYLCWAIEQGLDILVDKPLTAPADVSTNFQAAQQIFADYLDVAGRLQNSRSNLIVQCQRRGHQGYQFIKNYLADFVQQYQIPLSFINIYHADGMWPMPTELFERENHPYKYGYGKLLHSGYHFIDLCAWLAECNDGLEHKRPHRMDLFVKRFGGQDFLQQVAAADYERLFQTDKFVPYFGLVQAENAARLGEVDVFILGQLKRNDTVVTTTSINLLHNSFCRRAWAETPEDVYKGNGRVRHESLNLQVGNLLNIQVHSYQAYELGKQDVETSGAGHANHFDIYIFRNSGVVGGQPLEKFRIGEQFDSPEAGGSLRLGHNECAREAHVRDFLAGRPSPSNFTAHRQANKLLSKVYECIVRENKGDIPYLSFDW